MNISKGKKKIPYKVVIYGAEGIGKTTLRIQVPCPDIYRYRGQHGKDGRCGQV